MINLATGGSYVLTAVNNTETGANGLPVVRTDGGHTSPSTVTGHDHARLRMRVDFRIFQLAASSVVTINGLIIRRFESRPREGSARAGGGININSGTLTIVDCTLTLNSASNGRTRARP